MILRAWLASVGVICATLFWIGSAPASYDPVASGSTKLVLEQGFARVLAANGVQVTTKAGARRRGRSLLLPVSGGKMDPTRGKGEVESAGTVIFRRGSRAVKLRDVAIKTKPEPLVAKVGGGQLKLASAASVDFQRVGFGSRVSARPLRLTAKFATRLGKKLRLRGVFSAGQLFGSLRAESEPTTLAVIPSGRATFAPDPAFLAKLDRLFVSLNPIAPAERVAGPLFTLPLIPEGTISPDGAQGMPRTGGALEFLQLGSGQVFWQEMWIDLSGRQVLAEVDAEPYPTLPGKLGRIPVAAIGTGSISADPGARKVAIASAPLALQASAAELFNRAFSTSEFSAGDPLGSISLTAQTQ